MRVACLVNFLQVFDNSLYYWHLFNLFNLSSDVLLLAFTKRIVVVCYYLQLC